MKSKLFKLITGLGLFAFVTTVSAYESSNLDSVTEGNNSANASVTVGEVATPVYSVGIVWDDLTFDWIYDQDSNSYGWAPSKLCNTVRYASLETGEDYFNELLQEGFVLYSDETCASRIDSYDENVETYYLLEERDYASISIEDNSQNGQIVPSIRWQSEDKYSDVSANFKYQGEACTAINTENVFNVAKDRGIYFDSSCMQKVDTTPTYVEGKFYVKASKYLDLETEEIPDRARTAGGGTIVDDLFLPNLGWEQNFYNISMNLEGGEDFPTSGDTIGTVTVSIRAK